MLWYTWSRSTVKSFLKTGESLSNKSASRHASEIILSLGSTHEHQNTGFFPDDLFSYVMGTPMSTDVGVDHHIHSEDERKSYMLLQLSSEERCNFFFSEAWPRSLCHCHLCLAKAHCHWVQPRSVRFLSSFLKRVGLNSAWSYAFISLVGD